MATKFLIFDIETTGLPRRQNGAITDFSNWPYIVQIAWILFDEDSKEIHRAEYIIKPTDYYIPQSVTNVHGISHEYAVENGKPAHLVLGTFYELLVANQPIVIGHNVRFDSSITQAEFLRNSFDNVLEPLEHICTMHQSLKMMEGKNLKFPKLSELHFHLFNSDFIGHHRAMADVEATARCFFEMERLKKSGIKILPFSIQQTHNFTRPPKEKLELEIDDNPLFKKAFELIKTTNRSLFLTGKAGTGKSTFLKYVLSHIDKNIIVLAPTGIAALNVGGVTIHSFFRFPLRPLLPDDDDIPVLSYAKKKLIKEMDLLIIDEVSMVRVDLLDAIDASLRKNGGKPNLPFGGKQIILIGDIFQLEPVVPEKDGTKDILLNYYSSLYFFNAIAYESLNQLAIIELQKAYRQQNDLAFLSLLDKIRLNHLDENDFRLINTMVEDQPMTAQELLENDTIVLKTTNYEAEHTNKFVLDIIDHPSHSFIATISGEFPLTESRVPAPEQLKLKVDAQVMLLKNDLHGRWVNGTIAKIAKLTNDAIVIRLKNGEEHMLDKYTWENISYFYNPDTRKIETKVLGGYTQYPLRLAWAITIHKSQGLTFDKIKIDWGQKIFASGQVYVALSRCRQMNGVNMSRLLQAQDIIVNQNLIDFYTRFIISEK